jgi:hypothetical protein
VPDCARLCRTSTQALRPVAVSNAEGSDSLRVSGGVHGAREDCLMFSIAADWWSILFRQKPVSIQLVSNACV